MALNFSGMYSKASYESIDDDNVRFRKLCVEEAISLIKLSDEDVYKRLTQYVDRTYLTDDDFSKKILKILTDASVQNDNSNVFLFREAKQANSVALCFFAKKGFKQLLLCKDSYGMWCQGLKNGQYSIYRAHTLLGFCNYRVKNFRLTDCLIISEKPQIELI